MLEHDVPRVDDDSILVGAQTEFIVGVDTEVVRGKEVTPEEFEVGACENGEGQQVIDTPTVADSQYPGFRRITESRCNLGIPVPDRQPVVGQLDKDLPVAGSGRKIPRRDTALILLFNDYVPICAKPLHRRRIVPVEGENMLDPLWKFGGLQPTISRSYSAHNPSARGMQERNRRYCAHLITKPM